MAAGGLCLVFIAVGLYLGGIKDTVMLPDGSEVKVLEVKFGRTNEFGKKIAFAKHIPGISRLLGDVPKVTVSSGNQEPELAILFELTQATGGSRVAPGGSVPMPRTRLVSVDEEGAALYATDLWFRAFSTGRMLHVARLTIFPRTQSLLEFRVECEVATNRWDPIGTFSVPNPARTTKLEPWEGRPLPQRQTVREVEMILKRANAKVLNPGDTGGTIPLSLTIEWDLIVQGKRNSDWTVTEIAAWSADGNYARLMQHPDLPKMAFTSMDCLPTNQVWRVRAVVSKRSGFSDSELHTFTVPANVTGLTTNIAGGIVDLYAPGGGVKTFTAKLQVLPDSKRISIVKLTNSQGVDLQNTMNPRVRDSHYLEWELNAGKETNVIATIAIHDDYTFEFFVKPESIRR